MAHEADPDFFTGVDLELARWALQGDGSGSVFQVTGPPSDMYELFTCGEQTMDQLAQEFVATHSVEETVYRPEPPVQPHHDPGQPMPAITTSVPASIASPTVRASFATSVVHASIATSAVHACSTSARSLPALVPAVHALFTPAGGFTPDTLSHTVSTSAVPPEFDPATPDQQQGFDPAYLSAPPPSTHQVVRPRPQRPQRDRRPPACGTSSHLHSHPAQDSDQS
ncbi:hypothetical protein PIB30_023179 [Stylosanthes scabra]|uniref:Uncharacterized protein n=1 Tax=Stylosanthes scabra TaxID=79078 RepID=A0ABU6U8Q0_9FABA|nr:hypothetical protein [Stylosanthes scabra]